ncbi:MAG: PAS domain S-box protein [Sulfuricellaceae bacterium]
MIADDELAISSVSRQSLVQDMVGAPYLNGMVIGGNGRVIVSTDPSYLGRAATSVPGINARWLADDAPPEQFILGKDTLTSVTHLQSAAGGSPLYYTVITISTTELNAQKRSIVMWGQAGSILFILLSSAGIILIAQRLITRRVDASLAILKKVENGALEARIPVTSDDELGQLQHGINSMTEKVGTLLNQHRRNEEELSAILNAIGDGVIAVGPDGGILRCNPTAAAILGISTDAIENSRLMHLLPELSGGDDQRWWRSPESLTAHGRLYFERPGMDGTPRSIELGHGPIKDPEGGVIGAVLVLQDITARKQAEEKIRSTTQLLDSIVENIPNMIFLKRASDLRFVLFNKAGEQLLGYERNDLLGKNDYDFFPREQADFFTSRDRQVLQSATVLDIPEERIDTRHRGQRILHTRKLALHNSKGEAEYLLGISDDITERKHYEQALEREAQEWTQAMDAFADAIYLMDMEHRVVRANKMFYAMTGNDPAHTLGRQIAELMHSSHDETGPCPVCSAQENRQDLVVTLEPGAPHNPTGLPVEVTVKVIRDTSGNPHYLLESIHDLTKTRKFENELRSLNESLELRVKEEVAKNREKDAMLIQQSRLATMGEMMHNVAHQWRQPLSALSVILYNIKDDFELGEMSRESLEKQVHTGAMLAQKMSSTIDDFRNFFRPDHTVSRFSLKDSVRNALSLVEASFRHSEIKVLVDEAKDVLVEGYANEYSQVLLNILSNAKDVLAGKKGSGVVRISIVEQNGMGEVRIRDNGGGIPEEALPKIFDPYFTTKDSGTGIGLYMSRMIMGHMHGQITARNIEGGAEFVIATPLAAAGEAPSS